MCGAEMHPTLHLLSVNTSLCIHITIFDLQSTYVQESGQEIVYEQGNEPKDATARSSVCHHGILTPPEAHPSFKCYSY